MAIGFFSYLFPPPLTPLGLRLGPKTCSDTSLPISSFGNLFVLFESPSQLHSSCWYKQLPLPGKGWKKKKLETEKVSQTALPFVRHFATSLQVKFLAHMLLSALNLKVNLT